MTFIYNKAIDSSVSFVFRSHSPSHPCPPIRLLASFVIFSCLMRSAAGHPSFVSSKFGILHAHLLMKLMWLSKYLASTFAFFLSFCRTLPVLFIFVTCFARWSIDIANLLDTRPVLFMSIDSLVLSACHPCMRLSSQSVLTINWGKKVWI